MPWPQSQDYNEAIQNPQSSFGDPELRGGQAVTNAMGMPMPRSGNFADVYEFIGASGQKWAIKCFTRQIAGLQERYGVISKSLAQAKLPFMVDFDYLAKGIRIRGEFFPVLKMHWVEGFLLNEFVRNNLDKPSLLDALGQVWLRMAIALRRAGFAHADLQHGNVILVPGSKAASLSVRLIDYDGMWVPALAGKKSGEVGHANYQHPERLKSGIYSVDVDRFPHLVIYTALRSLMVGGPELWNKYDNGDNLLFKQADLDAPGKSPLFAELMRMNNPEVRKLVEILARAVDQPIERTPFVDSLAAAEPAARPTARKSEVTVEPRPQAESVFASITAATSVRRPAPGAKKPKVGMMVGGGIALVGLIGLAIVGVLIATGGKREEDASQRAAVQPRELPKQVEIGASSKKELDLPKDQEPKKDAAAKKNREPAPPVKDAKEPVRPVEKLEGPAKEKTKQPDGPAEKPEPAKKEAKDNDAPAPKIDIPNKDKVDLPVQPKVVTNGKKWDHLDLSEVQVVGDYLRLQGELRTKDKFSGELDITVVARTADKEIRLDAYNGACVIFNWEKNPNELRVNRPDGDGNKHESGTLLTAKVKRLAPNTWYSLRWQVTSTGMKIFVDDKMVFFDSRKYDLSTKAPVVVRRLEWDVDVKVFAVKEIKTDDLIALPALPKIANGLALPSQYNCATRAYSFAVGKTFNIQNSWVLSFDFLLDPNWTNEDRAIFLWGDDRPGRDPIYVAQHGDQLEAVITDCNQNTIHSLRTDLKKMPFQHWANLTFCYHAKSSELELFINGKLVRRELSSVVPTVDRPMPIWIGGANKTDQRFYGKVRNVLLGNLSTMDQRENAEKTKRYTNSLGMEFVLVPKGKSWLGGGGGKPGTKEVEIDHDFYLGQYEVTQEEWQKVTGTKPSHFQHSGGGKDWANSFSDDELKRFPVENIKWHDAQMFIMKLNKLDKQAGWLYCLPTQTEWEYACRGGPLGEKDDSAFDFYLGEPTNDLRPDLADFTHPNGLNRTSRVGSYPANRLGLYDMHGNVEEWCDDEALASDGTSPHISRGGNWSNGPQRCTATSRFPLNNTAERCWAGTGLRVARIPMVAEKKHPSKEKVYLRAIREVEIKMGLWILGKGNVGNPEATPIRLKGKMSPNGLGMLPPDNGIASARFHIAKTGRMFRAIVGINDSSNEGVATPIAFEVLGNGKLLWRSQPTRTPGVGQKCSVGIKGVSVLELRVLCNGSAFGAHAVWVEPYIELDPAPVDRDLPADANK